MFKYKEKDIYIHSTYYKNLHNHPKVKGKALRMNTQDYTVHVLYLYQLVSTLSEKYYGLTFYRQQLAKCF